ncbi:MAG: pyridoxamine kinase [Tissierellia bacterium]|nr:pyridoxamine kinase [Tissierellia bacterium]MDD4780811.1 pyridoxamine kinase [Tissierellia bacterium]
MNSYVPKIAAIHDISGIGRCSMTVISPIISALGCQVCPLPTAILSNHSEYKDFFFYDFTDHMIEYYDHWEKISSGFDCVYSGFIGSQKQIDIILDIIKRIKLKNNNKETLIVVDPVMGDHGFTYKTYSEDMISKMSRLVESADIITPNLTEACILTGKKYTDDNLSIDTLKEYLVALSNLGPGIVVITGIKTDEGESINVCFDKSKNEFYKVPYDYINKRYPGTGDLFTSLFLGYLLNNDDLPKAIEKASRFVTSAVLITYKANTPSSEGVLFEKIMHELYNDVKEYKYSKI